MFLVFERIFRRQSALPADAAAVPARETAKVQASDPREARQSARVRYHQISLALKAEAGVTDHRVHKRLSGLAWHGTGRILAPLGLTRRQLYVLAHECGHIVLHADASTWSKPGHVKEHEAETYAHRAFIRHSLEIPQQSSRWARNYVAQWIAKDRAKGLSICTMAEAFANGTRSPYDYLPALDQQRPACNRPARQAEPAAAMTGGQSEIAMIDNPDNLPIACGTCRYRRFGRCKVHLDWHTYAWSARNSCNYGESWRPARRFVLVRLTEAILDRISGRYRLRQLDAPSVTPADNLVRIEGRTRK